MNLQDIADAFSQPNDPLHQGYDFECHPIPGEVELLQISLAGREEIPIFVSVTDEQILCISYLWGENEIKTESRSKMLDSMLSMNLPIPLSAFSKIDDQYVLFGALSVNSRMEDLVHELIVLSDNSLDVIEAYSEYLK